MHYYQFNIKDYKAHTDHLSLMEDLAFRRMLDWIYLHEKPLPINPSDIAKRVLMPTHTESIEFVLSEFFELVEDGYINRTATDNIDSFKAKSEKASKSAKARWDKKPDADEMRTHSEGNANHKPLTTNHKPLTTNKELSVKEKDLSPKVNANLFLIDEIFQYWVLAMNKGSRTSLTTLRKSKISSRLKDGYPSHEIKQAIDNVAKDSFLVSGGHTDIEMICRNSTNLEKYRDASNPKAVLHTPVVVKRFFK
jgi:uncharacterized protein YdaU (DUF1376 family)